MNVENISIKWEKNVIVPLQYRYTNFTNKWLQKKLLLQWEIDVQIRCNTWKNLHAQELIISITTSEYFFFKLVFFFCHALLYWPHFVQVQVNIQGLVMDSAIFEILHSDGDTWESQMWRLRLYQVKIKFDKTRWRIFPTQIHGRHAVIEI